MNDNKRPPRPIGASFEAFRIHTFSLPFFFGMLIFLSGSWGVLPVFAQGFSTTLQETNQVLDSTCRVNGPDSVADGTEILILWDRDGNGPSANDSLAAVGFSLGDVNYNHFAFNGRARGIGFGRFISNLNFSSLGQLPSPNRFFLRVMLPFRSWESQIFSPSAGNTTTELGPWNCIQQCPPPTAVTGFQASDNTLCDGVFLEWDLYTDYAVDTLYLFRGIQTIARLNPVHTSFFDDGAVPGVRYIYSISAQRRCPTGLYISSPSAVDPGTRPAPLPAPESVTASDEFCDRVQITWTGIPLEADSLVIRRNGWILATISAEDTVFNDFVADSLRNDYSVCGSEERCGEGLCAGDSGQVPGIPDTVQNIVASESNCHSILVTWNDLIVESYYQVWRSDLNGSNLVCLAFFWPQNNTRYTDTTAVSLQRYQYKIIAVNSCGTGPVSLADTGVFGNPPQIQTFFASTATCGEIRLAWTASTDSAGVRISRDGDSIATVPATRHSFVDVEAAFGEHDYSLLLSNECGTFLSSSVRGNYRQILVPPQTLDYLNHHCRYVSLYWPVAEGVFEQYRIYRNGVFWAEVASSETSFLDSNTAVGGHYIYSVSTFNSNCGESSSSPEANVFIPRLQAPAPPNVTISVSGRNSYLRWNTVRESEFGCPLAVEGYLLFDSPQAEGPFVYLGFTTDTSFIHSRAIQFNDRLFYQIISYDGPLSRISRLNNCGSFCTEEQVFDRLRVEE